MDMMLLRGGLLAHSLKNEIEMLNDYIKTCKIDENRKHMKRYRDKGA